MSTSAKIDVTSETGRLRQVMIHKPGPEWDLVPAGPGVLARYLIEDIFVLSRAQREHELFTDVLGLFIGERNVIEFEDLLRDVCTESESRLELIGAVSALESLGLETQAALRDRSPDELARVLIRGAQIDENNSSSYENLFPPIPNLLFTRDLGVAVPGGFIVCHAAESARRRETLLMRYVLRHKLFAKTSKLDVREFERAIFWHDINIGERVSIEGGDVLVLNNQTLMIGTGERTTEAAFFLLLQLLESEETPVRSVIRAIIPKARASMHLDTVFTCVAEKQYLGYSPVTKSSKFMVHRHPFDKTKDVEGPFALDDALRKAGLHGGQFAECGDANLLFRSREQWTDGANAFCIAPGLILGYDRNKQTAEALKSTAFKFIYLEANDKSQFREIEQLASDFKKDGRASGRFLIGLPGAELSRARGGPRCMTMPLRRER